MSGSNGRSSKQGRTWISSEISPELMAALERRAKARGISRSEGLRQALRQWTGEEEPDSGSPESRTSEISGTLKDRSQRIVARLDDLREEIVLEMAGSDGGERFNSHSTEAATDREAVPAPDKPKIEPAVGLEQMQMYEGDDLLAWLDRETEKARRREVQKEEPGDREQ